MAATLLPENVPLDSHRKSRSAQTRRYGFFPGCVAKESCKELFNSTMLLADINGDKRADVCGRGAAGVGCGFAP